MKFKTNPRLQLAFDFVEKTDRHVFLTGKAGTGKTTFLHKLKEMSPKRMIVVAPTGVAAINAGGVTIHSFFQIGFGPQVPVRYTRSAHQQMQQPRREVKRFNRNKIKIMRSLDLLVIDEVSMVRADLMDAVDDVLRRFRDGRKPFGGVQLLLIGDLQQLSPVVKDDEWNLLRDHYDSAYFFSSLALKQTDYVSIELDEVFRQRDAHFLKLLNKVRENQIDRQVLEELNKRYNPDITADDADGYITLTTHNQQAADINNERLEDLDGDELIYTAEVRGDFPEYSYPTDYELHLKAGAQVMFVKNDLSPEKKFFNGKIGVISEVTNGVLNVQCEGDDFPIEVVPLEWTNTKYSLDKETQEIKEEEAGTFTQIPLKLAWAITIHKSQGLTFDKAIIDATAAFAFGQVYVALSRCRTLGGLVLSSRISNAAIHSDIKVHDFNKRLRENIPDEDELNLSQRKFQENLLREIFDFSQLKGRLGYFQKLIRENAGSLTPIPKQKTDVIEPVLRKEICGVAEKFNIQIDQLIENGGSKTVEQNEALQERIRKAGAYFSEKLKKDVLEVLDDIVVETDNKALRKNLKNILGNLMQDSVVAYQSMETCKDGFDVKALLEARAKAGIEDQAVKAKKAPPAQPAKTDPDRELFEALRQWRHEMAEEEEVPHFMILHQKALIALAAGKPASLREMLEVEGMGKKKVKKYGEELLEIIAEVTGKPVDFQFPEFPEKKPKPRPKAGDSVQESIRLYEEGKNIAEIAEIRELAEGTIVSHLSKGIQKGILDARRLLEEKKLEAIAGFLKKHPEAGRREAREALGEDFSWNDLNLGFAHFQKETE